MKQLSVNIKGKVFSKHRGKLAVLSRYSLFKDLLVIYTAK